ncbi:MAG: DUF3291 domain-containing protein [Chloroflexota bacterium]
MSQIFHLVEVNIARMHAPLDHPIMADFAAQLDHFNSMAEASPGFVWRLKTDEGDATSIRVYDDERIIVNLTMWESIETLFAFSFRTQHSKLISRRKEWFERLDTPYLALWWIEAGQIPTAEEAKARLDHLHLNGSTAYAFTFKTQFPMPQVPKPKMPK